MTLWFGASTAGKLWYLLCCRWDWMLGEEQFWVGSMVSPYVHHGALRWRCLWDLQVGVCSWKLEIHLLCVSPVLKDKHSNNCLRLDYIFYTASLEGVRLLKDLSIPRIRPSFCISPPPGSLLPYLLNIYHHLTSLPILLGLRVDIVKGPGCQTAFPRDCATHIPINGEGMSISPHSHQHGEVLFASFIDGDTFQ